MREGAVRVAMMKGVGEGGALVMVGEWVGFWGLVLLSS